MGTQDILALGLVAVAAMYLFKVARDALAVRRDAAGACGGGCGSCASKGQGPDVVSLSPPSVNGKR